MPAPLRRGVIARLARAYPKLDRAPRWLRAKHTLTEISLDSALGYYRTVCKVHHERRRALFSPALAAQLDGHDPAARIAAAMDGTDGADPLRQAQTADLLTYLPGDILTKVDRTSMASSLEVRAPMLDHEFVDWGLGLPTALKRRGRRGQGPAQARHGAVLAAGHPVPSEAGFRHLAGRAVPRRGGPAARAAAWGDTMGDSGLFDLRAIGALIDQHAAGQFDHGAVLWLLLVFEGFLATLPGAGAQVAATPHYAAA